MKMVLGADVNRAFDFEFVDYVTVEFISDTTLVVDVVVKPFLKISEGTKEFNMLNDAACALGAHLDRHVEFVICKKSPFEDVVRLFSGSFVRIKNKTS